jgi:hypothetical protein
MFEVSYLIEKVDDRGHIVCPIMIVSSFPCPDCIYTIMHDHACDYVKISLLFGKNND